MAAIKLNPPEQFDFKDPDSWPKWKRRFLQYCEAAGLAEESEGRRISTLLYCLGEEAEEVLTAANITEDERKRFESVLNKFDEYFRVRRNVIFERARFNQRNQAPGETAETYIAELYRLVEHCQYGAMRDELLRDRLVVGITDKKTSEQLQMDPALTLEKAKKTIRQKEAVREQGQALEQEKRASTTIGELEKTIAEMQASMDDLRSKSLQRGRGGGRGRHREIRRGGAPVQYKTTCCRCGYTAHKRGDRCPAADATCHRCQGRGHYSSMCFTKFSQAPQDSVDFAFLDELEQTDHSSWKVTLLVEQTPVEFKIDTGAAVTAITESTYKALQCPSLAAPTRALRGPSQESLQVLGTTTCQIVHYERSSQAELYVVKGLKNNLLGLPEITALHLVEKICSLEQQAAIQDQFPKVFEGLGTFGDEYEIKLKETAKPHALYAPRRMPLAYREKVKEELDRMEQLGVIQKVSEPTPWCAGIVTVPKKGGKIRICVDLRPLNESIEREVYPIPQVDDILAQIHGAKIFSKLDANSGFWQIPLAKQSRLLTTFVTPFGRYCFNKLPFGISSAPEVYQKRMNQILEGLPGVLCLIDDILIYGQTQEEHDIRLSNTLARIQGANATLNPDKCAFSEHSIKYLGHIIDETGIRADPEKTAAIQKMGTPTNVTELRRFMGMVNQLGKFSHRVAQISQPLRSCLSSKNEWMWGPEQENAFSELKSELTRPTILAMYDPEADTKLATDASSYGLGAVLLQCQKQEWRPVAYASRAMSETERRYAQIEKEALGVTWACEKFRSYLLGRYFSIETDHKPLVPLLSTKSLDALPPRIIRFRLRLAGFTFAISHVPGKLLYTADTLSRAPVGVGDTVLEQEAEELCSATIAALPASLQTLDKYRQAQQADPVCQQLAGYCKSGWPKRWDQSLGFFWKIRSSFSWCENLLLFNSRIVVPKSLQKLTLTKLHQGHQGIDRCQHLAKLSVWWPGITNHIRQMVLNCSQCAQKNRKRREPLLTTPLPQYPWQMIATDLFELNGTHYLLAVDYFSRYPEVMKMTTTTSKTVITALKSIFARHGIPEVVRSDNGPQYAAHEFAEFAESYGFCHTTSSPHFPQSNGQAERMVQTAKRLLTSSNDPFMALLTYRSTPLPWCGLSPAELCMGRRIRTGIPQTTKLLTPEWPYLPQFRRRNGEYKKKQKDNFNRRHGAREAPAIPDDTEVWVTTGPGLVRGTVTTRTGEPRSYIVETPSGELRRNRSQLNVVPPVEVPQENGAEPATTPETAPAVSPTPVSPKVILTRSRSGTVVEAPDYLRYN